MRRISVTLASALIMGCAAAAQAATVGLVYPVYSSLPTSLNFSSYAIPTSISSLASNAGATLTVSDWKYFSYYNGTSYVAVEKNGANSISNLSAYGSGSSSGGIANDNTSTSRITYSWTDGNSVASANDATSFTYQTYLNNTDKGVQFSYTLTANHVFVLVDVVGINSGVTLYASTDNWATRTQVRGIASTSPGAWASSSSTPLTMEGIICAEITGNVGDTIQFAAVTAGGPSTTVGIKSAVVITSTVPEPAALGLLSTGGLCMLLLRKN